MTTASPRSFPSLLAFGGVIVALLAVQRVVLNRLANKKCIVSLPSPYPASSTSDRCQKCLRGKIIMITGGGSGIGRAAAIAFAQAGCHGLVIVGRRCEPLKITAEAVRKLGSKVFVVCADITQPEDVRRAFGVAQQNFTRLDVLFNNAGTGAPAVPMEELKLADWQRVVDVNLTGTFLCTQEAFRLMKAQRPKGGRIINNGSVSADRPRPHSAPYTATKHAVTGLTKSTMLDGRDFDIACGQIDIGNAKTAMTKRQEGTGEACMHVADVGRALVYMAGLPLEANVQWMTVMASKMPLIGRG